MPTSPQLKEARNDAEFYKSQYLTLSNRFRGLHDVGLVIEIQREAGLLSGSWPGAERKQESHYDMEEHITKYKWVTSYPKLSLRQMIDVIIAALINQTACDHEVREKTGE